jgi:hypothetical protein
MSILAPKNSPTLFSAKMSILAPKNSPTLFSCPSNHSGRQHWVFLESNPSCPWNLSPPQELANTRPLGRVSC